MSFARFLAVRNCRKNPSRTAALGLVAALLALVLFGGSLVVLSLQNGLNRFQERLGADILVLPKAAQADGGLEGVLVQGKPLQFYMEASRLAEIASLPGVERAAPQFFLTSANAGCCSVAVQLIGFDPATDFTIRPWLLESYAGDVGYGDILCGSGISVPADRRLKFYNVPCRVVGRLSPTGTGMDTAVYAHMETIRAMMKNAAELDFASFQGVDPEQAISAVLVKTAPDFSPEAVAQAISAAYPDLAARPAHGMVRSVEAGLGGVTGTVGVLLFVVWLLCIGLLALAFRLVFAERRGEFAVLLISGARRGVLARIVLAEALIVSSLGAAGGILAGAFVLLPFAALLKDSFARPYLLPDASGIALLAAGTFCAAVLSAALAALWAVRRMDVTLREDM